MLFGIEEVVICHGPWIARNLCASVKGRSGQSWCGNIYKQCRQENCVKKEETGTVQNENKRCDDADININEVQGNIAVKFNI